MHPPAPLESPLVTLMCCSDDVILGISRYWVLVSLEANSIGYWVSGMLRGIVLTLASSGIEEQTVQWREWTDYSRVEDSQTKNSID